MSTTTTTGKTMARLLVAAAIIGAMTGVAATHAPGIAEAKPDSSSDGNSNNGSDRPERRTDPLGYHNPPVDARDRARVDQNRRDYYNGQRSRQAQSGGRDADGQSPTWTRVQRPDGSWYVCKPNASNC
ncbi:hypothetical protein [Nocardia altamirensis]|uniref:hypothetical protein n=1 Tax=Nocardia altamirensis TaxID=472158 RepID=UPI000840730E|nr:hypothetical protein [Nocardia altamirensis]